MFWRTMGILIALSTLSCIILDRLSIRLNGCQLCISYYVLLLCLCASSREITITIESFYILYLAVFHTKISITDV